MAAGIHVGRTFGPSNDMGSHNLNQANPATDRHPSALRWGRTAAAVPLAAFLPLPLLGLVIDRGSAAPVIFITIYGLVPALATVCVTFLPFHILRARRGRPSLWLYALWGALVSGGLWAIVGLAIPSSLDSLVAALLISMFFVFAGLAGGVIFHLIAFGLVPSSVASRKAAMPESGRDEGKTDPPEALR